MTPVVSAPLAIVDAYEPSFTDSGNYCLFCYSDEAVTSKCSHETQENRFLRAKILTMRLGLDLRAETEGRCSTPPIATFQLFNDYQTHRNYNNSYKRRNM